MTPIRIAISGPAGTGKTTLATLLAKRLRLPLIPEQIRVAAAEMGIADLNAINRTQRIGLQWAALALQEEEMWKPRPAGYVSDRSPMDYAFYYSRMIDNPNRFDWSVKGQYIERCKRLGVLIPFTFITPPIQAPESDGFRLRSFDDSDLTLYVSRRIPGHILTTDGPEARVAEIMDVLRKGGAIDE